MTANHLLLSNACQ